MSAPIIIGSDRVLIGDTLCPATLVIADGRISSIDSGSRGASQHIKAGGLLVLPGIVDIHGDAFERQMMPRSGVDFPVDVALIDSDRQAISNGITTVFHAATSSWEPGLRSVENAKGLLEAIEAMRPRLAADTRYHLRHETFNLDGEKMVLDWLAGGRIDLLAFNDHMSATVCDLDNPRKRSRMVDRTGLGDHAFDELVQRVVARARDVPASIGRLAAASRRANVRMLSHDDDSPQVRQAFRTMGVRISEFPVNEETACEAATHGDAIVFGAPNVVRGGSHTGWTKAADMIAKGLCTVLASDYYYPAQCLAAFRLAADGVLPLEKAWTLISSAPAKAVGLTDRGRLALGLRADLLLIDDSIHLRPRIVGVMVNGRLVYLTEPQLIREPQFRETAVAEVAETLMMA
jgi:alpha-D-ribose 1-methylphosphonate 5-triphosphate diphosphatase